MIDWSFISSITRNWNNKSNVNKKKYIWITFKYDHTRVHTFRIKIKSNIVYRISNAELIYIASKILATKNILLHRFYLYWKTQLLLLLPFNSRNCIYFLHIRYFFTLLPELFSRARARSPELHIYIYIPRAIVGTRFSSHKIKLKKKRERK